MSDNTYSEVSTKLSKTSEQQLESNKSENHYKNHSEYLYLNLAYEILSHGKERMDRTGTGTLSIFSKMMRFNINDEFPLLTTKKMFWKGIVEELLWFISGSTNSKKLDEKGVRIWNVHGSNEFLIKRGLDDRQEGDLGPVFIFFFFILSIFLSLILF
jgi:thymidylate synthase